MEYFQIGSHSPQELRFLRPNQPKLVPEEQASEEMRRLHVAEAFRNADRLIFVIGGSSAGRQADLGALGETVLLSGFLKATLAALRNEKKSIPITLIIDATEQELYREAELNKHFEGYYNGPIKVIASTPRTSSQALEEEINSASEEHIFALDFHGERSGRQHYMPMLESVTLSDKQITTITILTNLFQTAVWEYAGWQGADKEAERRFSDFLEAITNLPPGTILTTEAQPFVVLPQNSEGVYQELAKNIGLNPATRLQIGICMQSADVRKEYSLDKWKEALMEFSEKARHRFPGIEIDLTIFAGPEDPEKESIEQSFHQDRPFTRQDLVRVFGELEKSEHIFPHVVQLSLSDVAVLMSKMTLNVGVDAGVMHISGALHKPTVVLYLPGNIFPAKIWKSTLSHREVHFTSQTSGERQQERIALNAVAEAKRMVRDLINIVSPNNISETMIEELNTIAKTSLPRRFRGTL